MYPFDEFCRIVAVADGGDKVKEAQYGVASRCSLLFFVERSKTRLGILLFDEAKPSDFWGLFSFVCNAILPEI